MNLSEAFRAIEGTEVSARVNAASDLGLALRIAAEQPAAIWLAGQVTTRDVAAKVASRLLDLSKETPDFRYENPRDIAFLVYTLVLSQYAPGLTSLAVNAVSHASNLWWASKLVSHLMQARRTASGLTGLLAESAQVRTDAGDKILLAQTPSDLAIFAVDLVANTKLGGHATSVTVGSPSDALKRRNTGAAPPLVRAA